MRREEATQQGSGTARSVTFKIADVARAIKGARKGGMEPGRAEIDPVTGKIVVFAVSAPHEPENALDKWLGKRHA